LIPDNKLLLPATHSEPDPHDHVPEDLGQLRVGQGQGPQSKIGRGVGNRAQGVFDRVNTLRRFKALLKSVGCH